MQIKLFTELKSIEIALNTPKWQSTIASKIWLPNETKNKNTSSHMFLDHCYAFRLLL